MSRNHAGGFINESAYFDIGTEARRGRDGDTARTAAQKYNDHKHPAALITDVGDLHEWANEPMLASVGGYLQENPGLSCRSAGDTALYNGRLYASNGDGGIIALGGLGGRVTLTQDGVATLVPDRISTHRAITAGAPVSITDAEDTRLGYALVSVAENDVATALTAIRIRGIASLVYEGDPEILDSVCAGLVAPFAVSRVEYLPFGADNFAAYAGADERLSLTILGLAGNIPPAIYSVRGIAGASWGRVDAEISVPQAGVVQIFARLATLEEMYQAAGADPQTITEVQRALWEQAILKFHVDSQIGVTTLFTFGA